MAASTTALSASRRTAFSQATGRQPRGPEQCKRTAQEPEEAGAPACHWRNANYRLNSYDRLIGSQNNRGQDCDYGHAGESLDECREGLRLVSRGDLHLAELGHDLEVTVVGVGDGHRAGTDGHDSEHPAHSAVKTQGFEHRGNQGRRGNKGNCRRPLGRLESLEDQEGQEDSKIIGGEHVAQIVANLGGLEDGAQPAPGAGDHDNGGSALEAVLDPVVGCDLGEYCQPKPNCTNFNQRIGA